MKKVAFSAMGKKLLATYNKNDSWPFMQQLLRLVKGTRKRIIPTNTALQLDKFMRNRAAIIEARLANRSERLPLTSQLYLSLAPEQIRRRLLDPRRKSNVWYINKLKQHLAKRGFRPVPGEKLKMQWQLPSGLQSSAAEVAANRAMTAAQGALKDSVIGRYSPYYTTQSSFLSKNKLFQPQKYLQYPPSKLQQLVRSANINNEHWFK